MYVMTEDGKGIEPPESVAANLRRYLSPFGRVPSLSKSSLTWAIRKTPSLILIDHDCSPALLMAHFRVGMASLVGRAGVSCSDWPRYMCIDYDHLRDSFFGDADSTFPIIDASRSKAEASAADIADIPYLFIPAPGASKGSAKVQKRVYAFLYARALRGKVTIFAHTAPKEMFTGVPGVDYDPDLRVLLIEESFFISLSAEETRAAIVGKSMGSGARNPLAPAPPPPPAVPAETPKTPRKGRK